MSFLWIALMILFIIVEVVSYKFIGIWFAIGCFSAWMCTIFHCDFSTQIICFILISVLTLVFFRKKLQKKMIGNITKTGVDILLNSFGVVVETIDNQKGQGRVRTNGQLWYAKSANGENIKKGSFITVCAVEGAGLVVEKHITEIFRWK